MKQAAAKTVAASLACNCIVLCCLGPVTDLCSQNIVHPSEDEANSCKSAINRKPQIKV